MPTAENISPGSPTNKLASCDSFLKLGDTCDHCHWGIMLPQGGVAYYEALSREKNPRAAQGQDRLFCTRCGHWHFGYGPSVSTGLKAQ